MNEIDHPKYLLAKMARESDTKKTLATKLKGPDLAEAWRIKQVQNKRALIRPDPDWNPRPVDKWEIKNARPSHALIWPFARRFHHDFERRIAKQIKSKWAYGKYRWHEYHLYVSHSPGTVGTIVNHAGSGCISYLIHIQFDLLRQDAVWIGGLLTIRAKADKGKSSYPCWWFERRESDPHLHLRKGHILRRKFHQEDDDAKNQRLAPERLRRAQSKASKPTAGWVTEASSIKAGNCAGGTRNFIESKIKPWFYEQGFTVGDLAGAAVKKKLVLEIETSAICEWNASSLAEANGRHITPPCRSCHHGRISKPERQPRMVLKDQFKKPHTLPGA